MTADNEFLKRISLDGEWALSYCDIGKGSISSYKAMNTLTYNVPGDVHTPLIENSLIKEPLYAENDKECRWVEDKEFWCSKTFFVTANDIKTKSVITFEGLDCTADIWLNGQLLGRHSNSFVEIEYDISSIIKEGENIIVVRIDQGLYEVQDKELGTMKKMWNNEQPYRVYMRKPQYVYSWDWTIWLATCGIWKSVYINSYDKAIIADVYAYSQNPDVSEGDESKICVDVELDRVVSSGITLECTVRNDADYDSGEVIATFSGEPEGVKTQLEFIISDTQLWWSNGLGRQYMYDIEVNIKDNSGQVIDSLTRKLGIRSIKIEECDLGGGESTFTFLLNNKRVFCKGANHVPSDCLFARITPQRDVKMIEQAHDCNMNMLRIWGGGIYASEAMMTACDKLGIMVWHDFMYACGYYPDFDEAFMQNITDESTRAIRRLRNHTSLIGWSGNNEIQGMYYSQKQWVSDIEWFGGKIYDELLPSLVCEHCKNVIYRPSSPYGGDYPDDKKAGDQHIWEFTHVHNHPHYLDLWRFTDINIKFLSEFGIIGAMNIESARKCIPPKNLNPDDPVWLHHTNSGNSYKLLNMMVDKNFGDHTQYSVQQYILKSQVAQAEVTKHMYDEFRCRKFICSGLLFWTLGDSYGIHNWAILDYYLQKRPLYYYLKRAMAPLAVAIRGYDVQNTDGNKAYREYFINSPSPLEIWGMNDTLKAQKASAEYYVLTTDGKVLKSGKKEVIIPENSCVLLESVAVDDIGFVPENTILYTTLSVDGKVISDNRYFFAPFSQMPCEDAKISFELTKKSDVEYELEIESQNFVWMLHLETPDNVLYSDNDFDLIPNIKRKITVRTSDPAFTPVFHWIGEK